MTATTTVIEKALKKQDDFNEEISANKNDAIFNYHSCFRYMISTNTDGVSTMIIYI